MLFYESYLYMYIKESRVSYTIYNSRTAEPIWLKIGREVVENQEKDIGYFLSRSRRSRGTWHKTWYNKTQ